MGMAASQARYLALTARKTNTEWEGQQINQARTALANQSANLFNQLLNMEVPNAPKTSDYTKIQYSYSDGDNESIIEHWHQLNSPNPNYNYVVSHSYMADIFTGIKKMLYDPQVQLNNVLNKMEYTSSTTRVSRGENNGINVTYKINDYDYNQAYDKITTEKIDADEDLKTALTHFERSTQLIQADGSLVTDGVYGYKDSDSVWHFFVANEFYKVHESDASTKEIEALKKALEKYELNNNLFVKDPELTVEGIYYKTDESGNREFIKLDNYTEINEKIVNAKGNEDLKAALTKYEEENGLIQKVENLSYDGIYGKETDGVWSFVHVPDEYKPISESSATDEMKAALKAYELTNGIISSEDDPLVYEGIYGAEIENIEGNKTWSFAYVPKDYNAITEKDVDSTSTIELRKALTEAGYLTDEGLTSDSIIGKYDEETQKWTFFDTKNYQPIETKPEPGTDLYRELYNFEQAHNPSLLKDVESINYKNIYAQKGDSDWNFQVIDLEGYNAVEKSAVDANEQLKTALQKYEEDNNLIAPGGNLVYENVYMQEIKDEAGNVTGWNFKNTIGYEQITEEDVNAQNTLKTELTEYEKTQGLIKDGEEAVTGNVYRNPTTSAFLTKITEEQVKNDPVLEAAVREYQHLDESGVIDYTNLYGTKTVNGETSTWSFQDNTEGYELIKASDINLESKLTTYEKENNLLNITKDITLDDIKYYKDGDIYKFVYTKDYPTEINNDAIDVDKHDKLKEALTKYEKDNGIIDVEEKLTYDNIYGTQDDDGNWSFIQKSDYTKVRTSDFDTTSEKQLKSNLEEYEKEHNLLNEDGSLNFDYVYGKQDKDGKWEITDIKGYNEVTEAQVEGDEVLKAALREYEEKNGIIEEGGELVYNKVYASYDEETQQWNFNNVIDYKKLTEADIDTTQKDAFRKDLTLFEIDRDLLASDPVFKFDGIYGKQNEDGSWNFINIESSYYKELNEDVVNAEGNENLKASLIAYEKEHDLFDDDGNLVYEGIYAYQDGDEWKFINTADYKKITPESIDSSKNQSLKEALTKYETEHKMLNEDGSLTFDGVFAYQGSDERWHFNINKYTKEESYFVPKDYTDYSTVYGPSHVGNSQLTELNQLIVDKDRGIDQVADLAQILRDCPDSAINKYVSFDEDGNLQYEGKGIYTFNIYGKSYYTTNADLMESVQSNSKVNDIDYQSKLAYYTAASIPKKIESVNQALLETDGDGRFTTVKFDNDSAVYNLNVEEVTNEAAYENAMNEYLNKKAKYEKTIADINAKTSIIQKEDRTLELRLKQLDTEQNALATEMDAVKKVIKDNVEKTFKTFSD